MDEFEDCECPDPRREGRKLFLCGSALCKKLKTKYIRNGFDYMENMRIILSEDEEK